MTLVGHDIRQRDGARKQCRDHPDSQLEQGHTRSGQLKTWCTETGCCNLAEWVAPATALPPTQENDA